MSVLRKGALLLGLLSLIALSTAKLRWKCELFDTSQETSTKTSFVEFINNKPPEPNNPRITRSTSPKCRPRPKNGTVGPSTETQKMKVEKKKEVVQQDVPNSKSPGETDAPQVKYQRKVTHESTDLNIGPGFEESNDPYGRNKEPVPRRFRPAELKGADELDTPLTEQLDENVMPDFEFDGEDPPPVLEDLPWCPEEPETTMNCESVELTKLSVKELVELKQTCEKSVSPERIALIDKLIRTENGRPIDEGVIPTTDRTAVLPPTGATNCSESPSNLSQETLEKYRKECPCEEDASKMNPEEFAKFKMDCLEPLKLPGEPYKLVRKNGRCGASKEKTDAMSEAEYALFVKECLVGPKNITLKKILVIEKGPECSDVKVEKLSKKEFSDYRKKCVRAEACDEVDESQLKEKQLKKYKKMCSAVERKTKDICDEENVDDMSDEDFETYKRKCVFDRHDFCSFADPDSMSDSEYEKYEKECLGTPMDCKNVNPDELSKLELKKYNKECLSTSPESPPQVFTEDDCKNTNVEKLSRKEYFAYKKSCHVKDVDCEALAEEVDKMSDRKFQKYLFECNNPETCDKTNGAMSSERLERFEKECRERKQFCKRTSDDEYTQWVCSTKNGSDCDNINPDKLTDSEYQRYEQNCLSPDDGMDCLTVNPKKLNKKQRRRFERKCLEYRPECRNKNFDEMSDEEYDKFRIDCLSENPKFDCSSVDPDGLSVKEYQIYEEECLSDCNVDPKTMNKKELKKFRKNCVKDTSDCRNVVVEELSDEEYMNFRRNCVKERGNRDCSDVETDKMSEKEYTQHLKDCLGEEDEDDMDCKTAEPKKLSREQFRKFSKKCVKNKPKCKDADVKAMNDEEYAQYMRDCLRDMGEDLDCETVNPKKLSKEKYEEYVEQCVKDKENCKSKRVDELSEEEYSEFKRNCLTEKFDCSVLKRDELSAREYKKYEKECSKDACDDVNPAKLTRKQFKSYEKKCMTRKSSSECKDVDVDGLSDEEYEKYKRDCLSKKEKEFDCHSVEIENLSKKELKRYEKKCLERKSSKDCDSINPDDLSDKEYEKYKRDCLTKKKSKPDCDNIKPDQLSDKEYAKYMEQCMELSSDDCKNTNVEELSRKEYRKYQKDCLRGNPSNPDCAAVNLDELSDEEFTKYKEKCSSGSDGSDQAPGDNVHITKTVIVKNPEGGVSPDCVGLNPENMSENELADYRARCSGGTVTLIKKVIVKNGTSPDEAPVTNCDDVDVDKMAPHEYNAYKKYCKVHFEGEDCDDVRIDKLSEQKLREYAEKCGVFCGIDRPEALSEKQKKLYEKKCDGDTDELEKDCKDIDFGKLGERQYGDFAEKCSEQINACSMLKSRRLVRKVYNQYVSRCKPRIQPSESDDCKKKTDKMTLEEYKEYQEKCGKERGSDCDDIDVEELSEKQFARYKKRCKLGRESEGCEDIDMEQLSRQEFQKYAKKCGTKETDRDDDCESGRAVQMSKKEYLKFVRRCGNPADTSLPNCKNVDVESLSKTEFEDYKEKCLKSEISKQVPPGGKGSGLDCSNVDVEKLSDEEYKNHKRKCSTRKTPTDPDLDDCLSVNAKDLSDEEYKKKCGRTPSDSSESPEPTPSVTIEKTVVVNKPPRDGSSPLGGSVPEEPKGSMNCKNVNVAKLSDEEYEVYKKECKATRKTSSDDCDDVDVKKMSDEEYSLYQKRCGSPKHRPDIPADCFLVKIEELTAEEYVAYKKRCKSPGKPSGPEDNDDCSSVNVSELSDEEYKKYKRRCKSQRKTPDCSITDTSQLTEEELRVYKEKCGTERKPTTRPDCDDIDVKSLSDREYDAYQRRCGNEKEHPDGPSGNGDSVVIKKTVTINKPPTDGREPSDSSESPEPTPSVTIEKTVIVNKPPRDGSSPPDGSLPEEPKGSMNCKNVNVDKLSDEEYEVYKKECKSTRKTSSRDCEDVDVEKLSDEEYKDYKKRCGTPSSPNSKDCSDVKVEELTAKQYAAYKKRCLEKNPSSPEEFEMVPPAKPPSNPDELGDCKNVDVDNLTRDEYETYKKGCSTNSSPDCESVDVEKLSEEEFRRYKKRCARPLARCSDVNIEELSSEEYAAYKNRCGKKHPGKPQKPRSPESSESPESSDSPRSPGSPDSLDCSDINVEDLSSKQYASYKKRCLKRPTPGSDNCSDVDINSLSEYEYREFRRRCPSEPENVKVQKTVVISGGCQNKSRDAMTKEEYIQCSQGVQKPHVELTKIVKMVNGPPVEPKGEYECFGKDVNTMSDSEYEEFQKNCGKFHKTFQFNCNSDVSKMSDREFKKFRKACGKKGPFDCATADVDSLTDEEYSRFLKECKENTVYDCKNAKVERMSAEKYAEYRKKCVKQTTKSHEDCEGVKVEELSRKEYAAYKERCLKKPDMEEEIPTRERKKIDCSIVETSKMSKEEYADFKKHCAVKVQTDRYRPGENMILTKKVEIHTGKEKFSCYDRDVEKMSDEEYAEFEKRCLTHPHFRYDCSTVDTTNLSKEEYVEYQKECLKPKSVILTEKLVVNKTNLPVKNGCYNRNVDAMSDEEYAEYEVRCLGATTNPHVPTPKRERKTFIDCHSVDLSKLSASELEEHVRLCRSRETASTPAPRRRQSLKCSDANTENMDDESYAKWVKECLETSPKTITLEKKKIINSTTSLLTGGETVTVQKIEIRNAPHPDDDEGFLEGSEDFGVRIRTGVRKEVIGGRPDDDSESETGVILVKKIIHKIPKGRRPYDVDDDDDEGGVVEVKKLIMRTGRREPETDDSEDVEEIMRRPRKKVGPKEEVVLLSVTKRHEHPYKQKIIEEEEPTEIVQLKKNTRNPDKILREVRIRKKFGQGVPEEETLVQEIGGEDFRIVRKTVMVPRRVRKLKSTTTTTTTPAEPEYYYDEEEVPEVITLVKTGQSARPLRKSVRPLDEDEEFVDVREDQPESFIEFEGFVKVHGAPRKLGKRPKFTESGEEPEIREVTRKIVMQPGGEEDDLKGVKLRSHRKMLRRKEALPEEYPEDEEHEVTVVKKLKILKFDEGEKERFDDIQDVEDDGQVIVRNRKRQYVMETPRTDEETEEEVVEGRVAVKGRAPKRFRLRGERPERKGAQPKIEEETPQFYRIGGSEEEKKSHVDEVEKRRRRKERVERPKVVESEEEGLKRRKKTQMEEESEEVGRRPGREEEEEEEGRRRGGKDLVMEKIKKFYRIGPNGERKLIRKPEDRNQEEDDQGESITLKKKKIIKYGQPEKPEGNDESEEVKLLKRKKFYRIGPDGKRILVRTEGDDGPEGGEVVKLMKKKVYRIGPDGKKTLVTDEQPIARDKPEEDDEEVIKKRRKALVQEGEEQPDGQDQEEIVMKKKKRFYRIGPDGKRELIRTEGDDSPTEDGGEEVKLMKKKTYRIGPDGKRTLVTDDEKPVSNDQPERDDEEVVMKKRKKFYRIGPDGKRELIREEEHGSDDEKTVLGRKKSTYSPEPLDGQDHEEIVMHKKKRFYKIGPDGKRELVRTEDVPGGEVVKTMKKDRIGTDEVKDQPEEEDDGEKIVMKKKRKFYRIGPDGKRELIREEEAGHGDGDEKKETLLGTKKSSYSPEPLNDDQKDQDGEEIVMKKRKKFYRIGPDGKRELIRTEEKEGGNEMLGEKKNTYSPEEMKDGEEVVMHKKKRFYKIGPDGTRELVKEEGSDRNGRDGRDGADGQNGQNGENGLDGGPGKDGLDGQNGAEGQNGQDGQDAQNDVMGMRKTRRFYKIGPDGKRQLIRTENGDSDVDKQMDSPKKKLKAVSVTRRGFFKGGPLELTDSGEEESPRRRTGRKRLQGEERGPRKKRTYVLDGNGNRKLVADGETNLDLGKLLKPKKVVREDEMVSRKHMEDHSKVRRLTKERNDGDDEELSEKQSSSSSSVNKVKRKSKYHREDHLRASGKSEEEIPDPK